MTTIIITKIETFVILMLLGVIAAKFNVVNKKGLSTLSGLLVKITFPCLGFSLIYDAGTSLSTLLSNRAFMICEISLSSFLLLAGIITAILFRLPNSTKQIHIIQTMFGNQGFMNIPILASIFVNGEANVYIALFTLIDQILLWSLGIVIMASSDSATQGKILSLKTVKKILNPMVVSMIVAVFFTSFHIHIPDVLDTTITSVGDTSFSFALIFLGATLYYVSLANIEFISSYLFLVLIKMLVLPICVAFIAQYFTTPLETTILTLMAAMPAMSAVPMMAENYHSDATFASKTVFVMTVCSMVTIPLVFYLVTCLGIPLATVS